MCVYIYIFLYLVSHLFSRNQASERKVTKPASSSAVHRGTSASLFAFVPLLILSSSCSDFIFVSLVVFIQVTLRIVQARKIEGGTVSFETSESAEFMVKASLSDLAVKMGVTGFTALFLPSSAPLHYVIFPRFLFFSVAEAYGEKLLSGKKDSFFFFFFLMFPCC